MPFPFRTLARLALALPLLAVAAAPESWAQQRRQRTEGRAGPVAVLNRSPAALYYLYVTPVGEPSWGEDRLGNDTVNAGARFSFRLERGNQCRYDVRALYEGHEEVREETQFNVDLCARPEVVLDGRGAVTEADLSRRGPVALFRVRNRSGFTLQTLKLVSPAGEESEDILGSAVVANDTAFIGRLRRADGCAYSLVATFEGAEDVTLGEQNLCENREVVFGRSNQPSGAGQVELEIVNRSTIAIQSLNIRAAGTNAWGRDRLGSEVVAGRASLTVTFARGRGCQYDVRANYDNNQEVVQPNVNLCETRELAFDGPALTPGRGQRKQRPNGASEPQISQVTVVNESNKVIEALFISSSKLSSWGPDLLGSERIAPGGRHQARVERDDQCNFDIRIVYQGGREERRMRQNICLRHEVAFGGPNAFRIDGGGPRTGRQVAFVNTGRTDLRELYVTPVSDSHWGDDRLGSEVLPRRFRFELRLPQEAGCRWDVRMVFEGGQSVEKRDQDLCATPELELTRPSRPGTVASTGTGFYISATGHVLTNHHVVDGCSAVAISRPDGQRTVLKVLAANEDADLALLQQEGAASRPLALRAFTERPVRAGERVVLVGYPARAQLGGVNVTEGLVSGLRGALGDQSRFQYTAPTQPGNSGGPVLDGQGAVIGVVVSQIDKISRERTAQNINFGIKPDVVHAFLAANGVTPTEAAEGTSLSAAAILDAADASVLPLDCMD